MSKKKRPTFDAKQVDVDALPVRKRMLSMLAQVEESLAERVAVGNVSMRLPITGIGAGK